MRTNRNDISVVQLTNGMPLVHLHQKGTGVAYCGVAVRTGSRSETPDCYGLAHFVEHTIFKGTTHRRACHIINRMEAVGGELNAYTTKEETVVYSVFPGGNLARAAELIGDLISDSQFPQAELDKEREVVADEIDSYLDSPADAVFDDFEDLIFRGSALGHNILGTLNTLRTFDSATCRNFVRQNYRPDNMVAFYSGPQSLTSAMAVIDRHIEQIYSELRDEVKVNIEVPAVLAPFDCHRDIPSHQAHCIIGARMPGYLDPHRVEAAMLANILGGPGMNSLLNVEMRERRGLVYSVEASTSFFSDCGLMTIYFGCGHDDVDRCREIVARTIERLPQTLTQRRFEAAKRQYLGQLTVAAENRESSILSAAKSVLWRGRAIPKTETIEAIKSLTLTDLIAISAPLTSPSILIMSPNE